MYNTKLHFHFTGIGGSGMSGIAELLLQMGFKVSGSDLVLGATSKRLQGLGATVHEGHATTHLDPSASLLVYSSAVSPENPELVEAKRRGLPVVKRAEVLAELIRLKYGIVVAGSHGKTSTTSMIGNLFVEADLDPTVCIGGQLQNADTGSRLGDSNYIIAESDESDRSFLLFQPTVAILTNIDEEHMNAYSCFEDLKSSFRQFVGSIPFYGLAVFCVDHDEVRKIAADFPKRKVLYGFSREAELRAENMSVDGLTSTFDVIYKGEKLFQASLPMPGKHMVQNALAAIAVALEFGISHDVIKRGMAGFGGVKRRLEVLRTDKDVSFLTDYGHHPTEISATLEALRAGYPQNRIRVVFEPHRYTRTRDCYDDFCSSFGDCDELILTDIYPASEDPIEGIHAEKLAEDIDHPSVRYLPRFAEVKEHIQTSLQPNDIVLCLGAGTIGTFAHDLSSSAEI